MTGLVEDLLLLARLDAGRPLATTDGRPDRRWSSTPSATRTPPAPTTAGSSTCPTTPVTGARRRAPGCTRCWPTCWPTPARTRPPAPRSTTRLRADGRLRRCSRWPTTAPASRRSCWRTSSSGSPAATPRAPGAPAAPGWGWPSCTPSSPRTAARSTVTSAPGRTVVHRPAARRDRRRARPGAGVRPRDRDPMTDAPLPVLVLDAAAGSVGGSRGPNEDAGWAGPGLVAVADGVAGNVGERSPRRWRSTPSPAPWAGSRGTTPRPRSGAPSGRPTPCWARRWAGCPR